MRTSARARDRQAGAPSGVAPVARDTAIPRDPRPVGILTLAALAVVYTLYLGREFLLPVTLALVLKLLLQPAVRLLTRHLRLPATAAALLVILAVFGTVGLVILAVSVRAWGWIRRAPESLPLLREKLAILRQPIDALESALRELEGTTTATRDESGQTVAVPAGAASWPSSSAARRPPWAGPSPRSSCCSSCSARATGCCAASSRRCRASGRSVGRSRSRPRSRGTSTATC